MSHQSANSKFYGPIYQKLASATSSSTCLHDRSNIRIAKSQRDTTTCICLGAVVPRCSETRTATVDRASRSRETKAAGQKTNAIRVHEIFADAINYLRPAVARRGGRGTKERWVHRDGLGERAATHKRAAEHLKWKGEWMCLGKCKRHVKAFISFKVALSFWSDNECTLLSPWLASRSTHRFLSFSLSLWFSLHFTYSVLFYLHEETSCPTDSVSHGVFLLSVSRHRLLLVFFLSPRVQLARLLFSLASISPVHRTKERARVQRAPHAKRRYDRLSVARCNVHAWEKMRSRLERGCAPVYTYTALKCWMSAPLFHRRRY